MKINQVVNGVAVTTFAFSPSYISPITPVSIEQVNHNDDFATSEINLIDIEKNKVNNFIEKALYDGNNKSSSGVNLSIKLNKYIDDIEFTYVSIFSNKLSIDKLFDIEEQLNDLSAKTGEKYIFTVGE